ncbi:unnamed protein product [Penicillium egyptiacum]|uniref:Uncharacterized protein n=1 Tax=Penicillium egyptiacum TaxID=1303716 RepID=A0A9W4KPF4_9EURO|nr:unnamed protein product [Penicillium egyptiacum]
MKQLSRMSTSQLPPQECIPKLGRFSSREEGEYLTQVADLMERHADELAYLGAVCNVKPVKLFCGYELPQAVNIFRCKVYPMANNLEGRGILI